VVRFKEKFYRSPWSKYDDATVKSIKLMPPENSITNLKVDYRKMQGMIFGEKISGSAYRVVTDSEKLTNSFWDLFI